MTKRNAGFTLMELMIVIVIIGILAAIAYPSYQDSVRRSRRADAQGALLGLANAMERYFTENNTYEDSADSDPPAAPKSTLYPSTVPIDGGTTTYNLTIEDTGTTSFVIRATPTGPQAGDGYLEVNQAGQKWWDANNDGDVSDSGETSWNR